MTRGSETRGKSPSKGTREGNPIQTTTRLHELRQARGLGASEIARRVGVSRQTIYAIESGDFVPNTAVALQLARVLEVSVEDLFSIGDNISDQPLSNINAELLASTGNKYAAGELVRLARLRAPQPTRPSTA